MTPEVQILMVTAASIAFIHTLMGPDHYLPFVSMGAAKKWSMRKVLTITALCGLGHIAGSIVLGFIGVALQVQIGTIEWIEAFRGDLAAWALIAFGLVYFVWGMRKAYRNKPHTHRHSHGGLTHVHTHTHQKEHVHVHELEQSNTSKTEIDLKEKGIARMGPWAIFIIFVLGPCEPLIPILMYPAAKENMMGLIMITGIFGVVTMLTMLFAVWITTMGINKIKLPNLERYGHAMAGATIFSCGGSIAFLGL